MLPLNPNVVFLILLTAALSACGEGSYGSSMEQNYSVAPVDEMTSPRYNQVRSFRAIDDTRPLTVNLKVEHSEGVLEKTLESEKGQVLELNVVTGSSGTSHDVMWIRVTGQVSVDYDQSEDSYVRHWRGSMDRTFRLPVSQGRDELIARYAPTAAWNDPRFTPALGREYELMSLESGDSKLRVTFEINEGSGAPQP